MTADSYIRNIRVIQFASPAFMLRLTTPASAVVTEVDALDRILKLMTANNRIKSDAGICAVPLSERFLAGAAYAERYSVPIRNAQF